MQVLSVKENSVRIRTGVVTFDVLIEKNHDGKLIMKTPKNIFISNRNDFEHMAKLTILAYLNTLRKESTTNESFYGKSSKITQRKS